MTRTHKTTANNRAGIQAIFLTLCLLLAAGATAWQLTKKIQPTTPIWLQQLGGDFTLHSATGDVSLHDYQGRWLLLYFGYTHCPDICPTALSTMAEVIRKVGSHRVAGLFISLDPRRDTPQLLQKYTQFFHPAIRGVTGTRGELEKTAAQWRVSYHVPDAVNGTDNYEVEHTTFIYLVNPRGKVRVLLDERTASSVFLRYIRAVG